MLWRRSAPARILPAPGPVPDVNLVRQAVLQGSWRRDRWVARRRVAIRWALWFAGHYVIPALIALAAIAFFWLWAVPLLSGTATPSLVPRVDAPAPPPVIVLPQSVPTKVEPQSSPAEPNNQLRFDHQWRASRPTGAAPSNAKPKPKPAIASDKFSLPQLTPDN